jgi:hypothetical protein
MARAQSGEDISMAEALFQEGRRLMEAGKYAEACPKFEASLRIQSALGALYQLADCQEKSGLTASAWANFLQVAASARRTGQGDRERVARTRASALEPRLSRLAIELAAGADVAGLSVARDGKVIDRAALGVAVPVDPGEHLVSASAAGKKTWSRKVPVTVEGATEKVTIPLLEAEASVAVASTPAPATPPEVAHARPQSADVARTRHEPVGRRSSQRTIALVTGGLGAASVVVGAIFALQAKSKWDDARVGCPSQTNCPPAAVGDSEDANSRATVANIAFAVGAIGIGAGVALWFTAAPAQPASAGSSAPRAQFGIAFRGPL